MYFPYYLSRACRYSNKIKKVIENNEQSVSCTKSNGKHFRKKVQVLSGFWYI